MSFITKEFLHTLFEVESNNPLYVKSDNSLTEKAILENLISLENNLFNLIDCKSSLNTSLRDCFALCKFLISCYEDGGAVCRTKFCYFIDTYWDVLEMFEETEQIIICILQTEHWSEEQFALMGRYLNQIGLYLNDSNIRA